MVLLINHSREEFLPGDDDATRAFTEGVVPTDKMAFHQEMPAYSWCFVHADIEDFIAKLERHQYISKYLKYFSFFII